MHLTVMRKNFSRISEADFEEMSHWHYMPIVMFLADSIPPITQ